MLKRLWGGISGYFKKQGISLVFWLGKKFGVTRFKYKPLVYFLKQVIDPAQDVAKALTDSDPNDSKQLKEIWCRDSQMLVSQSIELLRNVAQDRIENESVLAETLRILEETEPKLIENLKC